MLNSKVKFLSLFLVYLVFSLTFITSVSAGRPTASAEFGELNYGEDLASVPSSGSLSKNIILSYIGGAGIQTRETGSWVGLGWGLNTGSISRMVSGIPDDYNFIEDGKTIYLNNLDDVNTQDTRTGWQKWGAIIVSVIVAIIIIVVSVFLPPGAGLAWGTAAASSALALAFGSVALAVAFVVFVINVALIIVAAAFSGGWKEGVMKLKFGKDLLFPALVSAGTVYLSLLSGNVEGVFKVALTVGKTMYGAYNIYTSFKNEGLDGAFAILKLASVFGGIGQVFSIGVGIVQSASVIAGSAIGTPGFNIGTNWKTITNEDTPAGEFLETPPGYITFYEYFANPELIDGDAKTDWFEFFKTENSNSIFVPKTALYGVSDIKGKIYQVPNKNFGKFDVGTQDSWSISGGPGGMMYFESFKGFRILSNEFYSPKIEYFRGDSGLIEMFIVEFNGGRYIYGSLDPDANDKTWQYIDGGHSFSKISHYEDEGDILTDNIKASTFFTVKPYVSSWKLTAILGPDYTGSLNPLATSIVKYNGNERSFLDVGSSNGIEIRKNGDYLCGGSAGNCEVVHDTSWGSWIALTYDRVVENSEANCGFNSGPLDGQPIKLMDVDGCCTDANEDGTSNDYMLETGGEKWEISGDEMYFGGFSSLEYAHKVLSPFGEIRFKTSKRLDALESASWINGAVAIGGSRLNVGSSAGCSNCDIEYSVCEGSSSCVAGSTYFWKTPWSFDFETEKFTCKHGFTSTYCAKTGTINDAGYLAGDAFTCEAAPLDYKHKLDNIEVFIYDDNLKPERVKKIFFNKDETSENMYKLKKKTVSGATGYDKGVYTLNNLFICGTNDDDCEEIYFNYNE